MQLNFPDSSMHGIGGVRYTWDLLEYLEVEAK